MPSIETLLSRPAEWTVVTNATNAASTSTKAAVTLGTHYITGITVSTSAVPAAALVVQVKDGTTVIDQFNLQTGSTAVTVIEYHRPLQCTINSAATVTAAAAGSGVIGTVSLRGFTAI